MLIGTPKYMAPEQALGQAVDHRADLYALGVITYELLTGTVPFEADSVATLLHRHAYEPPPPLREARSDLSPVVEAAVQRMLAKQPADRYPNGAAFVAALDAPPSPIGLEAADAPTEADLTQAAPTAVARHAPAVPASAAVRTDEGRPFRLPVPLYSIGAGIVVLAIAGVVLAFGPSLTGPASTPTAPATASGAGPMAVSTNIPSEATATKTGGVFTLSAGSPDSPTPPPTFTAAGASGATSPTRTPTSADNNTPGTAQAAVTGSAGVPPRAPTPTNVSVTAKDVPTATPTTVQQTNRTTPPTRTPTAPSWPTATLTPTWTTQITQAVTPTPTTPPAYTPTSTPTVVQPLTMASTPTAGTACRTLANASLSAMTNKDSTVTVAWSSTGGCGPFKGTITGQYSNQAQPFQTLTIGTQYGNLSSKPPPRCGGTHKLVYTFKLSDNRGQSVSATATTAITWTC